MRIKLKRRFRRFAAAAACAVLLTAVPAAAFAEEYVDISQGGVQLFDNEPNGCPGHVITGSTTDTSHKILVEGGNHKITLEGVRIDFSGTRSDNSPFAIGGNSSVDLTLKGDNYFASSAGLFAFNRALPAIWVEPGSSLTIGGTGSLEAHAAVPSLTATSGAAGIGGANNEDFGNVTINGGIIKSYGSGAGAGIGGGYIDGRQDQSGDVTINGGYVQAFGSSLATASGAGIGAGENGDYIGTITINGGIVHAIGGDVNQPSIGGGGHAFGATKNGTFTTGKNGNAVIVAPWGIGDTSDVANWDCILLETTRGETSESQLVNYTEENGDVTVTFNGGTPQVYGDVKADYNITVNSPASLRVETELDIDNYPETPNNVPSTLTMLSGTKLTNNNTAADPGIAGIALEPGSTLVLEDGTSQCLGEGSMIATSTEGATYPRGKVQLPLSSDMVSVNPTTFVYDGAEKKPAVTVSFSKWSFTQTFTQGTDYTVDYEKNINVGTEAKAVATSIKGDNSNLLDTVGGESSKGAATFEITQAPLDVSSVERRYVQVGEEHLLSKLPAEPTFGNNPDDVKGGKFAWYSDEDCTVSLADDYVRDESEGAEIPVYWKYTQTVSGNVASSRTGKTVLVMTNENPPAVQIDGVAEDINIQVKYGASAYTPEIKINLNDGQGWITPKSNVTYSVQKQQASSGDVVSVDANGITFVGAGTATVLAEIEPYTDPSAMGDDKGDSYGPAYVTISITVSPAEVSVDKGTVHASDHIYNGSTKVAVDAQLSNLGVVGDDLTEGKTALAATGTAAQPAVGSNIAVEVKYQLTGEKADDYKLTNSPDTTVNIIKAQAGKNSLQGKPGELVISNNAAATYVFNLQDLVPDSKQVDDGVLYPGRIRFDNPELSLSSNAYFDAGDITINNTTQMLYLKVNAVESDVEDTLGTITLDMISPNFNGMYGTITVKRQNLDVFTIDASAGTGGTITPEGNVDVVTGHSQTFTIKPDEGYEISDVIVDGESQGAISTYTFDNVTASHTITASFKKNGSGTGDGGGSVTPPVSQKVTLTYVENGGEPVADVTVARGTKVELATPVRTGYTFTGWYSDKDLTDLVGMGGDELTLTKNVTVYAGWEATEAPDAFIDDHINYVLGRETEDGTRVIAPKDNITRAEVATMVYRLLDENLRDEYRTQECDFADVPSDAWYAEPVATLAAMGAVHGYPADGLYHPNEPITRAELTAIVTRLDDRYEADVDYGALPFNDVPEGHWAS